MSYSKDDLGFLESIDTVLDYIIADIKKIASQYITIEEEDLYLLELNRFERANIILINFLENREKFNNSNISQQADKLVELIFNSLSKPELLSGTSMDEIEYLRENPYEEDDDDELLNNGIFGWYDLSKFDNENKKSLSEIVCTILSKNRNNKIYTLSNIDYELYNAISTNPELIKTLNWRLFEKLLADILERFEYDIELLKGTKDGGIDIIAIKKQSPLGIHRYLIQAKRWQNKVGVEPVRSLIWAHNEYRVTKSCLATTSNFTRGAWELANNYRWQIELKDYDKIIDWINLAKELRK